MQISECPSRNEDFCSRSGLAKQITAGRIFPGLFFAHNAGIGQKDGATVSEAIAFGEAL